MELAKFLQETIAEMARRNKARALTEDETQRFSTYVQKVSWPGAVLASRRPAIGCSEAVPADVVLVPQRLGRLVSVNL